MKDHIILIGADGAQLPSDSTDYVAVHNTKTGLMVARSPFGDDRFEHSDAMKAIAGLSLAGFGDWRGATAEEAFLMADRTRFDPAVDPNEYPFLESDWYWTSTVDPESPSVCAFCVYFVGGAADVGSQNCRGRVLAVRSVVAAPAGQ